MGDRVVGTCGRCEGPVVIPALQSSLSPLGPSCKYCGASPRNSFGPKIEMAEPGDTRKLLNE